VISKSQLNDLVTILLCILIFINVLAWIVGLQNFRAGAGDFRVFYSSGYLVRQGETAKLYDYDTQTRIQRTLIPNARTFPFIHPPFEAIIFAPLAMLSYPQAHFAFLALNLFLLVPVALLLRPYSRGFGYGLLLIFAFVPVTEALLQGQDSLVLLLICAVALRLLAAEFHLYAGVVLGLGLFRFQLVLPILLLFVLWKHWRVLFGFLFSAGPLFAASLPYLGNYWHALRESAVANAAQPIFCMANIRGLLRFPPVVLLASILVVWTAWRSGNRADLPMKFSLAIIAASLVSYHMLIHDVSLLLIPLVLLLRYSLKMDAAFFVALALFPIQLLAYFALLHFYLVALFVLALFAVLCWIQLRCRKDERLSSSSTSRALAGA